jgi:hypothetical protein
VKHSIDLTPSAFWGLLFLGLSIVMMAREGSLAQSRALEKSYEIHLREEARIQKSLRDAARSGPEAEHL